MAIFGRMTVQFLADSLGFNKGTKSASDSAKGFRKQADKTSDSLNVLGRSADELVNLLPSLAAGFSLFSATRGIHSTILATDAIGKQAESLGLAVEKLDTYQFAAGRAGFETERITDAIKTMNTRIGEAKLGSAEAAASFEAMGVPLASIADLDSGAQFERIGRAIAGIADQDKRVASFAKVFGEESGLVMQRFFENLPAAVKDLENLGGAITAEDAKAAADYANAIGNMQRQWEQIKRSAAGGVAPIASEFFSAISSNFTGAGGGHINELLSKIGTPFGYSNLKLSDLSFGAGDQLLRLRKMAIAHQTSGAAAEGSFLNRRQALASVPSQDTIARQLRIQAEFQRRQLAEQVRTRQAVEGQARGPRVELKPSQIN